MKKSFFIFIAIFSLSLFANSTFAQADQIVGLWKTIDDETGKAKAHVKIFKATNGYYYGRIVKLIGKDPNSKCTACKGDLKDKKVVGMLIITRMEVDGDELDSGQILDAANGTFYHCTLGLDDNNKDKLNVRGSIDSWGLAGRTQVWHRIK